MNLGFAGGHPGVRMETNPEVALHRPIEGALLTEVTVMNFWDTETRSGLTSS